MSNNKLVAALTAAAQAGANEAQAGQQMARASLDDFLTVDAKSPADTAFDAVTDVVKVPKGMSDEDAIKALQARVARKKDKNKVVQVHRTFKVFPWDGAAAMNAVFTKRYGWVEALPQPLPFPLQGEDPPHMITIDVDVGKTIQVPWGDFSLPDIHGKITTGISRTDEGIMFEITATVQRRSEAKVKELFDQVQTACDQSSIYRGKAIKIRFRDEDGDMDQMPTPKFIDISTIDESTLIFSREVEQAIRTNLFTPIIRAHDCVASGIPLKRGVLLGGTYGTGKTLAATVAAKLAQKAGITYLYIHRADELPYAINFAKHYQSPACVIFCEDIDRVMNGERSTEMDDILNIVDGIDSKTSNIMVVMTTNDISKITPAMLRPGRLDAVIEVTTPDAEATERLLRLYGRGVIEDYVNLREAAELLAGEIPAVIHEVIKRAKLAELDLTPIGVPVTAVSQQAILAAARTMKYQLDTLKKRISEDTAPKETDPLTRVFGQVVKNALFAERAHINATYATVRDIRSKLE